MAAPSRRSAARVYRDTISVISFSALMVFSGSLTASIGVIRSPSEELVDGDRQRAEPSSGGVVDRICDSRGHANDSDFAETLDPYRAERVRLADENDVDVGHVRIDGDQVVAEGGVRDATGGGVEDGLLEGCHPDAHDDAADDLAAGGLLVEHSARIDRRDDPRDPKHTKVPVDPHFNELRSERRRCTVAAAGFE